MRLLSAIRPRRRNPAVDEPHACECLPNLAPRLLPGHRGDQRAPRQARQGLRRNDRGAVNPLAQPTGMELDDVRRHFAVQRQGALQRFAVLPYPHRT